RRPVAALLASNRIGAVRVLAQQAPRIANALPADPRLAVAASGATIAATLEAVCADPATEWPLLVTTADHALLDAAMIEDFCARSGGADIAVAVVERRALLERLPATRRTWIAFRGGAFSGANLFLLASPRVAPAIALWRGVEQDRKKGWRLLLAMGPALFLGSVLRLLTIDQALGRIGRRLGLDVRAVAMADPLAAVDVDKPDDHRLVEAILAGRA
ncbi:MAG TPA: 4-diphosphocytidyl-2C-methyl-D-erythritol synthase, partial [Sphingomicrobium sp.]|nr:4-diphosphocytidyl-2C-methyl-D-erythritol synthase [Sphingomicrobium sp.]